MPFRSLGAALACALLLILPASASAYFEHVVAPGETLTSIAAADGLSVAQLAAANGLSTTAYLISGTEIAIPPQGESVTATPVSSPAPATTTTSEETSAAPAGGYVVQAGDTLSAIAARAGTSVAELAVLNGLNPDGILYAGITLRLPGGSGTTQYVSTTPGSQQTATGQPVGAAAEGSSGAPPYPTPEYASSSEIASIAQANVVPPALEQAIGWQESGWNNDLTSSAGAVGVMQVLPGTWAWINQALTPNAPLAPASASENIRGGVLLLHALLNSTGSSAMAAAGYYQGLSSVEQHGMYADTQQYVNNVMALERRFGG